MGDERREAVGDDQLAGEVLLPVHAPEEGEQQVDIHKPKPVHGWREFINEIGVIVIGVLIALGAEQAVEAWHWRHQVEAGEEALRDDVRTLVDAAAQREAQSPCLARRFAAISAILNQGSATGRLPAVGQLGRPSRRTWTFASWDSLVASQVPTHLPRERMLIYANLAKSARQMESLNDAETDAWTGLYTIVGPGRAFGDAEQSAVRGALSRAVLLAKSQREYASGLTSSVIKHGLLTSAETGEIRRKAAAQYRIDARDGIMCKPLAEAPPAADYGQAPSPVDLSAPFRP